MAYSVVGDGELLLEWCELLLEWCELLLEWCELLLKNIHTIPTAIHTIPTAVHTIPTAIHTNPKQFTITNNRISQEQLWNAINIAVIVFYFWIYNVFLDLTWYFCNHVLC